MSLAGVIAAKIAINAKKKTDEKNKEREKIWKQAVDNDIAPESEGYFSKPAPAPVVKKEYSREGGDGKS